MEREVSFGREAHFVREVCLRHDEYGTIHFTSCDSMILHDVARHCFTWAKPKLHEKSKVYAVACAIILSKRS